ncbi:hypothetical protein B484DRAFT_404278 [Ochromonadaceae sp. CCMP2298]|nr:hypothetical protein B484DRAFT_404278 [Ochromonadaceae sp. CCMP2298]
MNDKPKVITTKEAKAILQAQGVAVSSSAEIQKQRVVTFNVTISGSGSVVCKVLKFADRDFTQFSKRPYVTVVDKDCEADRMYIMLYQYGMADEKEQEVQMKLEEDDEDEENIDLSLAAVLPAQLEEKKFENHAALFCDKAFGQIAALRHSIAQRIEIKKLRMLLGKYAGGCSMTQSGNDNGQMHLNLHACFKSPSFRYDTPPDRPGPVWADLKMVIRTIDSASFKSVWKCLSSSQDFLAKAFTPISIKSAFRKTGVVPYRPATILSKCPHFRELKTPQARSVLLSIEKLADIVEGSDNPEEGGMVLEDQYLEILGASIDDTPVKSGKPLNEMNMGRQRALIINHPGVETRFNGLEEKSKVAGEEAAERKKRKAEKAEGGDEQPVAKKPKAPKVKHCSNPCCNVVLEETARFSDEGSSSSGSFQVWTHCGHTRCQFIFCPKCPLVCTAHQDVCVKPVKKVQKQK